MSGQRYKRRRPTRKRKTVAAGDLVSGLLHKHRLGVEVSESRVSQVWPTIVGERIAARSWPVAIRNKELLVAVANPSWLHQLSFLRDEIVDKVNGVAKRELIDSVHLELSGRSAKRGGVAGKVMRVRKPKPKIQPPAPADGADLERIEHDTGSVDDDELRDIIANTRKRWNL